MTVLELKKELDKIVDQGYGALPCVIYHIDIGKHDLVDVRHVAASAWKEHVEIGASLSESRIVYEERTN